MEEVLQEFTEIIDNDRLDIQDIIDLITNSERAYDEERAICVELLNKKAKELVGLSVEVSDEKGKDIAIGKYLIDKIAENEEELAYNLLPLIQTTGLIRRQLNNSVGFEYSRNVENINNVLKNSEETEEEIEPLISAIANKNLELYNLAIKDYTNYVDDVKKTEESEEDINDAINYSNKSIDKIRKISDNNEDISKEISKNMKKDIFDDADNYYSEETQDLIIGQIIDKSKEREFTNDEIVEYMLKADETIFSKIPEDEFTSFVSQSSKTI